MLYNNVKLSSHYLCMLFPVSLYDPSSRGLPENKQPLSMKSNGYLWGCAATYPLHLHNKVVLLSDSSTAIQDIESYEAPSSKNILEC
ncbi:hypothetical protein CDAR_194421 [Caerostris darwini]|uniref:Uncharacterized protein n=1 Tax=Caerostris darwini TaxID=1538125 RepID=A0AAV4SXX3_9ARAC|nr:hypothetical protein CDAR_194421 [Caerostris darwini]